MLILYILYFIGFDVDGTNPASGNAVITLPLADSYTSQTSTLSRVSPATHLDGIFLLLHKNY